MKKMIGVVGGVGSYAGIDLIRKIYDQTEVTCDQDHLSVSMRSIPHKIADRTEFLLNQDKTNPGFAIAKIITDLVNCGSQIIAIPCNTAHASPIFDVVKTNIPKSCQLLHLIEEVGSYVNIHYPNIQKVGVLATSGTLFSKVYSKTLKDFNIDVIYPDDKIQNQFVQPAIYNKDYGIKIQSNPVTEQAKNDLLVAAGHLIELGAEAIILGCTEIPMALTHKSILEKPAIDATFILASALIRESKETD